MIPTSNEAKRVAWIFHRSPATNWSDKEVKKWREIQKTKSLEPDLCLMERYYLAERKKGDRGMHRRDLQTLLNNWPSELDRARQWEFKQPRSNAPRAKLQKPLPGELPEEMRQRNLVKVQEMINELRRQQCILPATEKELANEAKNMEIEAEV